MPESADIIYKTSTQIVADIIAAMQARVPDFNVGPDSILRIWAEVYANTAEGLYLAQQLLHDDMFPQSANALALIRFGEMFGRPQKGGVLATGSVRFAGSGGTYIPIGTHVGSPRPSLDDELAFTTTQGGTIPNPGIPGAPVATDAAVGGVLTGTYEYGITFVTLAGESDIGPPSNALVVAASKITVTAISLGGPGTTGRNIYRRLNGGAWGFRALIADNVTNHYDLDNGATTAQLPPDGSTAERITLNATATDVGTDYNVFVGTVTDMIDVVAGLSEVTNLVSFVGGVDPEDIETFRTALLQFIRAPMSGSPNDMIAWASAIDGVASVAVFPNVNLAGAAALGTVSVRISGPGGIIPSGAVVAAVLAELQSHDLANITILVGTFVANVVAVTVALTFAAGYVLADVQPSVLQAITDYINSIPVGGTVYRAGIYHAVYGLPGVLTLNVTLPAADVAVAVTEKATVGVVTIT